jgi:hypothetical protein
LPKLIDAGEMARVAVWLSQVPAKLTASWGFHAFELMLSMAEALPEPVGVNETLKETLLDALTVKGTDAPVIENWLLEIARAVT